MATINQLVRKPRKKQIKKSNVPALASKPAEKRSLHAGLYYHSQETELRVKKGS